MSCIEIGQKPQSVSAGWGFVIVPESTQCVASQRHQKSIMPRYQTTNQGAVAGYAFRRRAALRIHAAAERRKQSKPLTIGALFDSRGNAEAHRGSFRGVAIGEICDAHHPPFRPSF